MKSKILLWTLGMSLFSMAGGASAADAAKTTAPAVDAAEAAKLADIRRLMTLTGAADLGLQVMNQMISSLKMSNPTVPDTFWTEFMKEVKADEIVDISVPVYAKYLTHDEIKEVIRFYETAAGKKLIKVLPPLTQELMVAGQQWGQNLGMKALKKLEEKGFK